LFPDLRFADWKPQRLKAPGYGSHCELPDNRRSPEEDKQGYERFFHRYDVTPTFLSAGGDVFNVAVAVVPPIRKKWTRKWMNHYQS
jgi:hypothetical protein